ncbi:MAG: hypothetical protein ACRDND_30680 [Streptosporangiaceae bacterium]
MGSVLAVAMMAVLFFAGAWGYFWLLRPHPLVAPLTRLPAGGGPIVSPSVLVPLIAVAATGLLAGILVTAPRISPLAAGLPGLLLLGWTAMYVVSVRRAVDLIPLKAHAYGAGFEAMLVTGLLGAAGLAMIIPLFVPSRWRRRGASPEIAGTGEYSWGPAAFTGSQPAADDDFTEAAYPALAASPLPVRRPGDGH